MYRKRRNYCPFFIPVDDNSCLPFLQFLLCIKTLHMVGFIIGTTNVLFIALRYNLSYSFCLLAMNSSIMILCPWHNYYSML